MTNQINIITDYREEPSKIPDILEKLGANVIPKQLKSGDYIINNEIIVERKTKEDFVLSIIQGRLFTQCAKMKKTDKHLILLIEGNPYQSSHKIDRQAVKGALISVSLCWQIPIIYSADINDSAQTLIMAAKQVLKENYSFYRNTKNSKNLQKKAIYFLQGLPAVGPVLAKNLLIKFGSIENVILAEEHELMEIDGLGKKKAQKIRRFLGKTIDAGRNKND